MATLHFKLDDTLRRHKKSALALARASGLAKTTVYNIVNNKAKAVELETLGKLLSGLERLTGATMTLNDVLERGAPEGSARLEALLKNAKPFDWEEAQRHVPDWTPEERAENERVWAELEREKEEAREHPSAREVELLKGFGVSTSEAAGS